MREFHGLKKIRKKEYAAWLGLKTRCNNPNFIQFYNYGGRGIKVSKEWEKSFTAFYNDMGNSPFPEAQLDRKDNNGNYCKENCRWATRSLNIANKREYDTIYPRGVIKEKRDSYRHNPYLARIRIEKITYQLGYYKTAERAGEVFQEIYKEWYG